MSRLTARKRGYGAKWERARLGFLRDHPFCVACASENRRRLATVVDHKRPHRGDQRLFWDPTNWQALCAEHHDRDKQQAETWGYSNRVGPDGLPTDPRHPFNRGEPNVDDVFPPKGRGVSESGPMGAGPAWALATELVSDRGRC
ncbi:HNH endonuclease signature motif containing protein [Hansschlegelia plantiphila]|uniref:HNH nuclease domain-containing protein n=1 Tax=Hansschlegelia plantiphila TaxID=374655 RepID=A0A9W6MVL1_9HYPH|nr:HNH endonuclease signature motif containing protein [Hansschlegelia plantiphila]GLK68098.1 hypothetical protein GCM10008179_17360 [Hansschlegelia plantiphila]